MKAFRFPEPGRTELLETPDPLPPRAGEILLRVRYIGFCGTDLNTFRGRNPLVAYPRIPGHEISATIVECGPNAPASLSSGMDVTVSPYTNCGTCSACRQRRPNCCRNNETLGVQRDGAFAEYITVPAIRVQTGDGLSLRELALVEPLGVGFHGVARGRVTERDTVVVMGCGAVGLGAVAGAAVRGARTIAVDLDPEKLETARQAGAAHVINGAAESLHERLQELTNGEGPEVIIEAIGLPETFRAAVDEVGFAGRVVYIGYAHEPVSYQTKLFVQKELDILGARNSLAAFPEVIAMLRRGSYPVGRTITRTVSMEEAGSAMAQWSADTSKVTRILVQI